jgi:hypothetical protein
LTPVYISVDQPFLHKAQPWYRVPRRRPKLVVEVGDDIDLEPYRHQQAPKASRLLNVWLLAHYEHELAGRRGYNEPRGKGHAAAGQDEGPGPA